MISQSPVRPRTGKPDPAVETTASGVALPRLGAQRIDRVITGIQKRPGSWPLHEPAHYRSAIKKIPAIIAAAGISTQGFTLTAT